MANDSTARFTSRVYDYVRYRPSYPPQIVDLLVRECGLSTGSNVADIGSGTGILTRLLLDRGLKVFAIEPNAAMREAAEESLMGESDFHSVDGTAERTILPEGSIDLVVAAQAFHWFDREGASQEFRRILRSPKWVALIWNNRVDSGSLFLTGYEAILRNHATDYLKVRHKEIEPGDLRLFIGNGMKTAVFPNSQRFDFEGVVGRLMSSSYAPPEGDPHHGPMLDALRNLFDSTEEAGTVEFKYETQMFYGVLD